VFCIVCGVSAKNAKICLHCSFAVMMLEDIHVFTVTNIRFNRKQHTDASTNTNTNTSKSTGTSSTPHKHSVRIKSESTTPYTYTHAQLAQFTGTVLASTKFISTQQGLLQGKHNNIAITNTNNNNNNNNNNNINNKKQYSTTEPVLLNRLDIGATIRTLTEFVG